MKKDDHGFSAVNSFVLRLIKNKKYPLQHKSNSPKSLQIKPLKLEGKLHSPLTGRHSSNLFLDLADYMHTERKKMKRSTEDCRVLIDSPQNLSQQIRKLRWKMKVKDENIGLIEVVVKEPELKWERRHIDFSIQNVSTQVKEEQMSPGDAKKHIQIEKKILKNIQEELMAEKYNKMRVMQNHQKIIRR